MSLYHTYLEEVENRRKQGLAPKPIDDGALLHEIILQIKDQANPHRDNSLEMLDLQYGTRHHERCRKRPIS